MLWYEQGCLIIHSIIVHIINIYAKFKFNLTLYVLISNNLCMTFRVFNNNSAQTLFNIIYFTGVITSLLVFITLAWFDCFANVKLRILFYFCFVKA